jgi:hypothetical protein
MDDRTRTELLSELHEAEDRATRAQQEIQTHVADIGRIRRDLGNPYFYSGRPATDAESQAHFTGHRSHEPAFVLWLEWREASRRAADIRRQLAELSS